MCGVTNYTVLRNDKAIAFMVEERDARLLVEAPVMYDLLKETLRYFSEHDIDSQLKLNIDDCLLRVDGSPLQSEKGRRP